MTAEELRQRLDGAKERVSSQPRPEPLPQNTEAGEEEGSSVEGEESEGVAGRIKELLRWLWVYRGYWGK